MRGKGMTPLKSGCFYLTVILCFLLVSFLMIFLEIRAGRISLVGNVLMSEGVVLIPALLFASLSGADAGEVFRMRKVKPSTLLFTILYVLCLEPLITALNAFSMIFTDNRALRMAEEMVGSSFSFPAMLLLVGIIGPFCEELAFRGVAYAGLRRSGRIRTAILLQALMFGCMHLNLNQMPYAAAIGIAFGLLTEVTGSIWPGFLGHFLINSTSVAGTFLEGENLLTEDLSYTAEEMASSFAIYAVLSVFFTALAACILVRIADNEEGGSSRLKRIFKNQDPRRVNPDGSITAVRRPHAITVPAVLGLLVSAAAMIAAG